MVKRGMPRFVTVTLNPALDSTYIVPRFFAGEVNRTTGPSDMSAGGKGINVARVLNTLCGSGDEVIALGCAGGEAGSRLKRLLDAEKLSHAFTDVSPVETRQALVFVDTEAFRQTVVNEPGALLGQAALSDVKALLTTYIRKGDYVLFCGSLPPGFPAATYADLIEEARRRGAAAVLLDTSGEPLAKGARHRPDILKVNQIEFAGLFESWRIPEPAHLSDARDALGVSIVAVTEGAKGAKMAYGDSGVWRARMPRIDVLSAVGSGDAFYGGANLLAGASAARSGSRAAPRQRVRRRERASASAPGGAAGNKSRRFLVKSEVERVA